jgi:hypothetical protein
MRGKQLLGFRGPPAAAGRATADMAVHDDDYSARSDRERTLRISEPMGSGGDGDNEKRGD